MCGPTPCPPSAPITDTCLPFWVTEELAFYVTDEVGTVIVLL